MIVNNNNFLVKEIPNFHPIAQKYDRLEFWKIHKRRCVEGYWVSGKWMPPELYYYTNFHTIIFEEGANRTLGRPWLRDIDWDQAFLYTEACGFSGFEKDDKYTCNRHYGPDKAKALKFGWITEDELTKKKYISAREYLRKNHGKDLGKALYENSAKNIIELASRGYGKDLEINTLVHSETGAVRIGDIKIGEKIYGADGKLTTVLSKDIYNNQEQYEVTLKDGRTIECGGGHLWGLIDATGKYKVLSINDIKDNFHTKRKDGGYNYKYFVPITKEIEYPEKNLPIDPYFLGLWLGDGCKHRVGITTQDQEIVDYISNYAKELKLKISINQNKNKTCPTYFLTEGNVGHHKREFHERFKTLNLINNKHIPEIYLNGSVNQRMELLRGLMDSDGYCGKEGNIDFSTTLGSLYQGITTILDSLGIRNEHAIKVSKAGGKYFASYRINIITSKPIFKLTRKLNRLNTTPSKYAIANREKVAIRQILKKGVKPSVCIGVDNKDKLFVAGERYIVTHNSYGASGRITHNFLFDGARDYDLYLEKRNTDKPYTSETVVGAIDAKYSNDLLEKVKVGLKYLPGEASLKIGNETEYFPSPLGVTFTGSIAPGRNYVTTKSESKLYHRTFQDNPFAANGTRPNRVFIDEVGFMNNLLETWGAVEATQAAAEFRRLCMYGMGTGGLTTGGAALYAQEIFYNPEQYDCLAFEDEWEQKGKICYFVPATKALNMFKEGENKISNEEKALEYIMDEREEAKNATSRTKLQATIINKPVKPSEIFLRMEGTLFPTADLNSRLADLEANKTLLNSTYKIHLNLVDGKPKISVSDKYPIRDFPLRKGNEMDSCIEVFELPKKDSNGQIPFSRYIAGWDPVDTDGNDDIYQSLQSIFVMDSWTNRIVAEYTARTYLAENYYEQARRLFMFYNALCLYENKIKGPYGYFKNKNSLHYLAETPEILKDQNLVKGSSVGNKALGVATNDAVKVYGLGLILSWLEEQAYDRDLGIRNLDILESPGLIKELVSYNPDINVDRIMGMVMLMILREDRVRATDMILNKRVSTKAADPFFDKAFKKSFPKLSFR